MSEPVIQTITPVTHDLGGFKVRRVLPSLQRTMVGPFSPDSVENFLPQIPTTVSYP